MLYKVVIALEHFQDVGVGMYSCFLRKLVVELGEQFETRKSWAEHSANTQICRALIMLHSAF